MSYNFAMRGTNISAEVVVPASGQSYYPDAIALLQAMHINTVCVFGGGIGDVNHFNMNKYPSEWATNLDNFLTLFANAGIKVYFYAMGTKHGLLFGIVPPSETGGEYPPSTIAEAKAMIDKLAGNNSLSHNFITDSRVLGWRPANEPYLDTGHLSWYLTILDYIRGKGGKAWLSSPRVGASDQRLSSTLPLINGHVDFLENHFYFIPDFVGTRSKDYASFHTFYENYVTTNGVATILANGWSLDDYILGEFGIWHGLGNQWITATFTDADRQVYYHAVLDAARDAGVKNVMQFNFFDLHEFDIKPPQTGLALYGIVKTDETFYPAASIIESAFVPTSTIDRSDHLSTQDTKLE